jgi:hypothetical protein
MLARECKGRFVFAVDKNALFILFLVFDKHQYLTWHISLTWFLPFSPQLNMINKGARF